MSEYVTQYLDAMRLRGVVPNGDALHSILAQRVTDSTNAFTSDDIQQLLTDMMVAYYSLPNPEGKHMMSEYGSEWDFGAMTREELVYRKGEMSGMINILANIISKRPTVADLKVAYDNVDRLWFMDTNSVQYDQTLHEELVMAGLIHTRYESADLFNVCVLTPFARDVLGITKHVGAYLQTKGVTI